MAAFGSIIMQNIGGEKSRVSGFAVINDMIFSLFGHVQCEQFVIKVSSISHVQLPVHREIRAAGGYPSLSGTRGELWVSGGDMLNIL